MSENDAARQQLSEWFHKWGGALRRHLAMRSKVSFSDADDIAQEVFLRMMRYDRAKLVLHPQAYLFKIAANVLVEWSTRASWRAPHAPEWLMELADDSNPELECSREEGQSDLRNAVDALPPRTREILRMHYEGGLTHEVIAQTLGITRRIVKRDLIRAYAVLRESLSLSTVPTVRAQRRSEGR